MNALRDMVPGSLRHPVGSSRFVQALHTRAARTVSGAAVGKRVLPRLPFEPEDAVMTGVTRSLERRLLGLNIVGA